MASARAERIATNYPARLDAIRREVSRQLGISYSKVTEDDIRAAYAKFMPTAARTITAGQAAMQRTTRAYIRGVTEAEPLSLPSLAGTSKAGTMTEALDGIRPFILGAISDGSSPSEALTIGAAYVDRMADNELTRVVDAEIEGQAASGNLAGWEGITNGATDECTANEGQHSFSEEMVRHPNCRCVREVVPTSGPVKADPFPALTATERDQVVDFESDLVPTEPGYVDASGWGMKRGADGRLAQLEELDKARPSDHDWPGGNRPFELEAEKSLDAGAEAFKMSWLESATTPYSAMMQRLVAEDIGGDALSVWSDGLPLFEPSPVARSVFQRLTEQAQSSIKSETVTVYRGLKSTTATRNALESWTTDIETARRFDGGAVLQAEVPRSAVFMDLRSYSNLEAELVLMGSRIPVESITQL